MMYWAKFISCISLSLVLASWAQARFPRVETLYSDHCASCHGESLRGGLAGSLLDDVWVGGDDDASLFNAIHDGIEEQSMPSFGSVLSEAQIRSLVIYIREKQNSLEKRARGVPQPASDGELKTRDYTLEFTTVVDDLDKPWAMAFLPDGRMLITEKTGQLRIANRRGWLSDPVKGIPEVIAQSQGGLLDVQVHPDYKKNGWVYLSFSHPWNGGNKRFTKIVRGRIKKTKWFDEETIFEVPAAFYTARGHHFGCRIVFDHEGYLYFSVGDRGEQDLAQKLDFPQGKLYRLHDDGRVPEDNPFGKRAFPGIWTYGNRNPQGMAVHPGTGEVWETEHGPRGGDELNLVQKGKNYGWPVITHGMNYNGRPITGLTAKEGMEQPITHWTPSIAISAMCFVEGDALGKWKHDLLIGSLRAEEAWRLVLKDNEVVDRELILKNEGRIRDIDIGPDGAIYLVMNTPDRVVRLAVKK